MVALRVTTPHHLQIDESVFIKPTSDDVAIRVAIGGICGSDIHILHGSNPFAEYPRIIGHEFSGTVEAIGDNVSSLKVGDRVVVDPVISCGHCYPCRIGRANVCANLQVIGVHCDGGFRSHANVPAANAVVIPDGLSFAIAALAEPLSVAANILSRTGCEKDDTILLYGAGTVGLTVLQVAKMKGARVISVDIDDARLQRALDFGADKVIHSQRQSVVDEMTKELDGLGPSLVIDCAGIPALLEEACAVAAPAGRIGIVGFSPAPTPIRQQDIVKKELTIVGSRLNRNFVPEVLKWLGDGRLKPQSMITHSFDASDAAKAFELIENHPEQTLKVQLIFS